MTPFTMRRWIGVTGAHDDVEHAVFRESGTARVGSSDDGDQVRTWTVRRVGMRAALTVVLVLTSLIGFAPRASAVSGPQNFVNARIADVALRYVGQSRPTGFNQPGECVKWVQSWVAEAGGSMPGGGPLSAYRTAGAAEIPLHQAQRGDIFQISQGNTWNGKPHTGVFTSSLQNDGTFDIVAGNVPAGTGRVVVSRYRPSAPVGHEMHVWRFGREGAGDRFANGSFLRAAETGRVYRVVGGSPLWLSSCVEGCPGLQNVSQATIDAMPPVPASGSFLRAAETGRVYRVVGGAPLWLSSCVDGCPGLVNVNQWTIDVLDHLRAVPENGSFLRAAETGRVYRVAGGAPLWLSSCVDGCPGLVNVNQWTIDVLDHLRAVPDNGTLLRAIETGRIYQVNDGIPVWLSACPTEGCGGYVQVNQWTIDSRDHLRS